jgi:hypothetical protein
MRRLIMNRRGEKEDSKGSPIKQQERKTDGQWVK